jgi:hypothetical protein
MLDDKNDNNNTLLALDMNTVKRGDADLEMDSPAKSPRSPKAKKKDKSPRKDREGGSPTSVKKKKELGDAEEPFRLNMEVTAGQEEGMVMMADPKLLEG